MTSLVDVVNQWLAKKKPLSPDEYIIYKKQISAYIDNVIYKGDQNPFTKTPYMNFRETEGNNRSFDLDQLIQRNGGQLGDSYCVFGIQDILRGAEKAFGISFDLPKGGSVVGFYKSVKPEYKISTPKPYSIGCYELDGSGLGHMVLSYGPINPKEHSTFEFNTSPNATQEIVRNGAGCYFKVRNTEGFGKMKLLGFVDIFEAIKK